MGVVRFEDSPHPTCYNPTIKAFAQRLKAAGKPFKVIMTACMRKLLTMLNSMVRSNTPWNPEHTPMSKSPRKPTRKNNPHRLTFDSAAAAAG